MGDKPRSHGHLRWKIGEQTRCCNHCEQKVAKEINWTKCISERVIATFIMINRQRITLMSVYMPHSGHRVASLCFSRCGPLTSISRAVEHGIFRSTTGSWSFLEASATRQATQQTAWGETGCHLFVISATCLVFAVSALS